MPLQRTTGQCNSRDYKTARVPVCCHVLPKGGRQHGRQARDVGPDYHLGCPSDASSRHWPSRRAKRSSVCCYSRASSCRRSTLDATSDTSDTQAQQRSCHLTDGTLAIAAGACCSVALLLPVVYDVAWLRCCATSWFVSYSASWSLQTASKLLRPAARGAMQRHNFLHPVEQRVMPF